MTKTGLPVWVFERRTWDFKRVRTTVRVVKHTIKNVHIHHLRKGVSEIQGSNQPEIKQNYLKQTTQMGTISGKFLDSVRASDSMFSLQSHRV
jgi:hypothetical protein